MSRDRIPPQLGLFVTSSFTETQMLTGVMRGATAGEITPTDAIILSGMVRERALVAADLVRRLGEDPTCSRALLGLVGELAAAYGALAAVLGKVEIT